MLADQNIGVSLYALSYGELDQRPGHRMEDQTEIALRKGIKAGYLEAEVETDLQRHCSIADKILLETREQITERLLAAAQKSMGVPRLGRPCAVRRVWWEGVAFQHDDLFEKIGERARRRQACHPGADHDRPLANHTGCHCCLPRNPLAQ